MKMRFQILAVLTVPVLVAATGCGQVRARMAFKDGNKLYKEENYKQAILEYQRATEIEPDMAEAWFYLGSCHQALFRPGKDTADNREHLEKAIEFYKKSLETNKGTTEGLKKVKANALGALTAIYTEEPFKNFDLAQQYANELVQANPDDAKNLYAMANLYEKFGKIDQAEQTYRKVAEMNQQDPKACGALAAFYNKPLWEGRSKFDQAIEILQRCATLDPNDPGGYQKVATFYWDKAYRDPLLGDPQKDDYADKGLEAVEKALSIKPDYFEAIIFKGLLYRVKAQVAKSPQLRAQYLDQAATLQKQGLELKKEQVAEASAAASPSPSAPGS
jgi:tetratricopeptide (TPR) repeat protein